MINSVIDAINRFSLIEKGDTVTVALSGGADSVALLHSLLSVRDELQINVKAAHLNHLIRGDEAFRDEAFVIDLCERLKVELTVERIDIPKIAEKTKQSLELCARKERYAFFGRIKTDKVATAHTASDNAETQLLNLTRGSGIKGLCGIPPKRDIYIRPLILCTRQDVENYCENNSLSFVTDSTNLSDDYTRNKIRHNVLPLLKEINPAVLECLTRTSLTLTEDNSALDIKAEELLFKCESDDGLVVAQLCDVPPAIAKRAIIKYVNSLYNDLELYSLHINALYDIALKGGKTNLPQCLYGICKNGILTLCDGKREENTEFSVKLIKKTNVNNLFSNDTLDCDKIIGSPKVRKREAGDTIRLKNRGCTKSLNKLFCENKILPEIRDSIPVVADDIGVIWVYGLGASQRVAPTDSSKNLLIVEAEVLK